MPVGLGITAPTYAVGSRIDKTRTACAARRTYCFLKFSMTDIANQKAQLRQLHLRERDRLTEETRIEMSLQASHHGMTAPALKSEAFVPGTIVSGFLPIRSEIDPRPLMSQLSTMGARLCLPVVVSKTKNRISRTSTANRTGAQRF